MTWGSVSGGMKRFEPGNVYEVLQPLFAWTRLFGLTPFTTSREAFRTTKTSLAITVLLLAFFTGISLHMIINRKYVPLEGFITSVTDNLEIYCTNLNMILAIFFTCTSRNKVLDVIRKLKTMDSDTSFLASDLQASYTGTALYLTVALFAVNIYLFLSFLFGVYMLWDRSFVRSAMEALTYLCPKAVTTYVLMQFSTLNVLLAQRFALVNVKLAQATATVNEPQEDMLEGARSGRPRFPRALVVGKLVELIDRIRLKHYDLCNLSYELNSAYSVQILSITLQIFVILLSSIFYCVRHIMKGSDDDVPLWVLLLYTANIGLLAVLQMIGLTFTCSRTKYEAMKTGSIIHKTVPVTLEKEMEFELLFFSMQLVHHNVDYTACRIVRLDEGLLLSMCGAICTYLVIIIQFEFGTRQTD